MGSLVGSLQTGTQNRRPRKVAVKSTVLIIGRAQVPVLAGALKQEKHRRSCWQPVPMAPGTATGEWPRDDSLNLRVVLADDAKPN
jgi:hypothetical protein